MPIPKTEQRQICGLIQMARHLRVSSRWLLAEAKAGRIPALRAGTKYLFNPTAVESSLAERAKTAEVGT